MTTREREKQRRKEERKRNLTRIRGWIIVWMLRSGIARPPRLNCDQGLNGNFQGRWRYVTDFYDLFAFAVRPVVPHVLSIPSGGFRLSRVFCRRRTPLDFEVGSGSCSLILVQKPSNSSLLPYTVHATKIEVRISFTVQRGKETLQRNRRYWQQEVSCQ